MSRAFRNPAYCQDCGKRFDSTDQAWEDGKGGITGRYHDPEQAPFAFCRRCLDQGGRYTCSFQLERVPVRERRRRAVEAVAQGNRAQFRLVKGDL